MRSKKPIASQLQQNFVQNAQYVATLCISDESGLEQHPDTGDFTYNYRQEIDKGMRLGTFLYDCGWLEDSGKLLLLKMMFIDLALTCCLHILVIVLNATKTLISKLDGDYTKLLLQLDCYQKLLHVQASFCCYKDAAATTTITVSLIDRIQESYIDSKILNSPSENILPDSLFANFYQNLSVLHFNRSEYDLSYSWSVKALKYLRSNTPAKISVDVLRQAAKSCVVKRKFQIANLLINSAVRVAE